MSKPETPCHPDCYVGAGGSILHAPGCTKNAPKAEAPPAPKCNHAKIDPSQPCDVCPPAPVSEPPNWMEEARDMAFEELNRAYLALLTERDALKAEVAELKAELERLEGIILLCGLPGWEGRLLVARKAVIAARAAREAGKA